MIIDIENTIPHILICENNILFRHQEKYILGQEFVIESLVNDLWALVPIMPFTSFHNLISYSFFSGLSDIVCLIYFKCVKALIIVHSGI